MSCCTSCFKISNVGSFLVSSFITYATLMRIFEDMWVGERAAEHAKIDSGRASER